MYTCSILALALVVMPLCAMEPVLSSSLTLQEKERMAELLEDDVRDTFVDKRDVGIVRDAEHCARELAGHNERLKRDLIAVYEAFAVPDKITLQKELDIFCRTWDLGPISIEEICNDAPTWKKELDIVSQASDIESVLIQEKEKYV